MATLARLPHAPETSLPELATFLTPFTKHFRSARGAAVLARYSTGLLTEHPHTNCDTLAQILPQILPHTSEQQFQHLLTDLPWDAPAVNRQRMTQLAALPTEGDGVLLVDDTGFGKQGAGSAGVARQYSGTLGKVGNCQVVVGCVYAERTLAWPVDVRLYVPEAWTTDRARCRRVHIPDDVPFQTKPQLALALLDEARAQGVRHACVTTDADYGDNPTFLQGLEDRQERYVVAVRCDFTVTTTRRAAPDTHHRADTVLQALPRAQWTTVTWAQGAQGPLRAKAVAVRCWRVDGAGQCVRGWLIGQRPARGQTTDEWKYFWSNCPADTPLVQMLEYAHRRHWIEQFFEEAKDLLGWDELQSRRYDAFYRHAVIMMLTFSFLVWHEWRTRSARRPRGRPRAGFSPSA